MPVPIDRSKFREVSHLELFAKQEVEGFIVGMHKSPFHGFSVEFAEHRQYNPGESTRHIDWKLFGRTDKLYTKKYEEETNLRCQIVIDTSSSMYYPEDFDLKGAEFNKIKFSVYAAAALTELLRRQRDAVGLSLFNTGLTIHRQPKTSLSHIRYLYDTLEELIDDTQERPAKETLSISALHEVAESTHRRSIIIIFSDMMDSSTSNLEEQFTALQHMRHNKHEVILFHVHDKKTEKDFEFENRPYTFVDMESGKEIKVQPNQVKDSYVKASHKFYDDLKMKCAQYSIDFIEADIRNGIAPILTQYLIKRRKMR